MEKIRRLNERQVLIKLKSLDDELDVAEQRGIMRGVAIKECGAPIFLGIDLPVEVGFRNDEASLVMMDDEEFYICEDKYVLCVFEKGE